MKKLGHQKHSASKFISFVLVLLFVASCAKEMDEKLPDNAERDIHSLQLFSHEVVIETVDETQSYFKLSSNEVEQGMLALNELQMRKVKLLEGPRELAPLFENVQIESMQAGQQFRVKFKLTDSRVSAFFVADNHPLSTASKQLVRNFAGDDVVPFFHFSGVRYGILKRRLNSLDEPTRFVDFELTNRNGASHINFTGTAENRVLDGLYGEDDSEIMLKSRVHGRHWNPTELSRFFDITNARETSNILSTYADIVTTEIIDNTLYVFKVVSKSSLNPLQESFLESGDKRIKKCDEQVSARAQLPSNQECVLMAVLQQSVGHVKLDLNTDNGEVIGTVKIETGVDPRSTDLINIPLAQQVRIFRFKDVAHLEDDNVFRRRSVEDSVHSAQDVSELMQIPLKNQDRVKTKLLGNNLLVMLPVAKSQLSVFEYDAYLSGDPRFEACPSVILTNWNKDEECILATRYFRPVTYSNIRLELNEDNELADVIVDQNVNRLTADILKIDTRSTLGIFEYDKNLRSADEIIVHKKMDIDTDAEYLYVPMTYGAPREVIAADPFFKGNEKIVKLRFTKDGLEAYEEERDDRFRNNTLNEKPVLFIPGDHRGFKCIEDAFGDCSLSTTTDNDKEWSERNIFAPRLESLRVREVNSLDLFTLESDPCLIGVGVELVNHTIEKGVLNIELEKTYKTSTSWRCIAEHYFADTINYSGFSNAGFKVQFHYSLVKLEDLVDPNYEAIAYPLQEHSDFGFFKNFEAKLDDFFTSGRMKESYLLNRWSPNKSEISYYLSKTFDEPGQELIKEATYKAVEGINRSLKEANAGISIKLEGVADIKPGDLRYNVIQLITDPLSNGLLGYAPSVKNPRTGEIVHAHINMYSGVVRSMSRRVWQAMVVHSQKEYARRMQELEKTRKQARVKSNNADNSHAFSYSNLNKVKNQTNLHPSLKKSLHDQSGKLEQIGQRGHEMMMARMRRQTPSNYVELKQLSPLEQKAKIERDRLDRWAQNNAYAEEFFRVAHTVKTLLPGIAKIPGVMNVNGILKSWDQLTDSQKKNASDIITTYSYTSTFVHEFGHNLGLRHNFSGSYDAANFYSEEEARQKGLRQAPAYSSIMDYAFSEMNELTIFGKYDIAALRYAYAREVELKNGQFVKIESTLTDLKESFSTRSAELSEQEATLRQAGDIASADTIKKELESYQLREYRFCTDSNAGLSSTCNRFDEGSSLVEITDHMINAYEDRYHTLNFRDGRNEFKDGNLMGITIWNMRSFDMIRNVFEEWEFFADIFGQDLLVQGCGPAELNLYPICKDINDKRDAVLKAGQFFINVLKTPDLTCAVIDGNDREKVDLINFAEFYEEHMQFDSRYVNYMPKSCFEKPVVDLIKEKNNAIVVAENGKYFNELRGNNSNAIYADDREVIGTWTDKILAVKSLFQREKSMMMTETGHMSLVEHPAILPEFMDFIEHMILDTPLSSGVAFKDPAGRSHNIRYKLNDYVIKAPADYLEVLKRFLGTNLGSGVETSYLQPIMHMIGSYNMTDDRVVRDQAHDLHNIFAVRKTDLSTPINREFLNSARIQDVIYSSTPANAFANKMVNSLNANSFLKMVSQQNPEVLSKVLEQRLNPSLPAGLNEMQTFLIMASIQEIELMIRVASAPDRIPLEAFINALGAQRGPLFHAIHMEMDEAQIREILEIKLSLGNVPPTDAQDLEKTLYSIDIDILQDFVDSKLDAKTDFYVDKIKYLLEHKAR